VGSGQDESLGMDASRDRGNFPEVDIPSDQQAAAGVEAQSGGEAPSGGSGRWATPTVPLVPLLHGMMSVPVAGGLPSSDGFSMGNEVPSSNGLSTGNSPPGDSGFPASGGRPAMSGLSAIDDLLASASPAGSADARGAAVAGQAAPGEAGGRPWRAKVAGRVHPASSLGARLCLFLNDPRMPRRVRRAAGVACVGTAVTVLAGWQLGLAAMLLAAAADVLYSTRTSPVVPAAARAVSAQRRTKRRLNQLSSAGYLSLHTRLIPGADVIVDHLVVGPAGVYLMASERWDRRLPVRSSQGGQLFHGPFDQSSRIEHARQVAAQASMLISAALGQRIAIRPAMVIHGPPVPWVVARISGVDVLCGRRLRRYLRREKTANRGRRLDEKQIEFLHAVASQVLPSARARAIAVQRGR
jgi:hypothetical protein